MQSVRTVAEPATHDVLAVLLGLARAARESADRAELAFVAVNDTRALADYRQAALWFADEGVAALSGVVQPEANAPYVHWLDRTCRTLSRNPAPQPQAIDARALPAAEAAEWSEWLPAHGLWLALPAGTGDDAPAAGGLLLAREQPWQEHERALLAEWMEIWRHAWHARSARSRWSPRRLYAKLAAQLRGNKDVPWWKRRAVVACAALGALMFMPVRLTVLAPGELVPANPAAIRAPLDGVVAAFEVKPNDEVKAGAPLFYFDQTPLLARLAVASQEFATSLAEYRQAAQLAVSDVKSKAQLAPLTGKIEERRTEVEYLRGQLERSRVVAPADGIALFDDPVEWIGKPVVTGERIMRIAARDDIEVEAWLAVGDAVPLDPEAPVKLYLSASPLVSVPAKVRYVAHDAVQRPDGSYAYRVRATLAGRSEHRVGLKGTAKLSGAWVPAIYWVLRRPLAAARQGLGW